MVRSLSSLLAILAVSAFSISAQSTSFSFQGTLKDGGNWANGNYDFEFRLFDAPDNGTQLGSALSRNAVPVSNGLFKVDLDFGNQFPGAARYLETRVRVGGSGGHTILTPRQLFSTTPYAIKAANATSADTAANAATANNASQLGGLAANQYVITADPRLSDPRPPTAGSNDYIQNQNAVPQAASNFRISGTGRASVFNAATRFDINSQHALSVGVQNTFVGSNIGTSTTGFLSTFIGWGAGRVAASGDGNTFVGARAGWDTATGADNTFVGADSGASNVGGANNAFFGRSAGHLNSGGSGNAFFGDHSGSNSTTGSNNTFIGTGAGAGNQTGSNNSAVGSAATLTGSGLSFATAIGSGSTVSTSNSVVLGRPADTVRIPGALNISGSVGVGTTSPSKPLHVVGDVLSTGSQAGYLFSDRTNTASQWLLYSNGFSARLTLSGVDKLAVSPTGILSTAGLAGGTSTHACWNTGTGEFSNCSSSIRYKSDVYDFGAGLDIINKLRPVSFTWRATGKREIGFIAEETAEVEPLLTYRNKDGLIEGINYDQISVILVNAVKAQQTQIERLENEIKSLRKMLCRMNADTNMCDSSERTIQEKINANQ